MSRYALFIHKDHRFKPFIHEATKNYQQNFSHQAMVETLPKC